MTGTVKSFSPANGYGFIDTDKGEYWFHASEWMGRERPQVGDKVDFMPLNTEKGKRGYIVSRLRRD